MKKTISIILIACFLVSGITVAASFMSGIFNNQSADLTDIHTKDSEPAPLYITYDKPPVFEEGLSLKDGDDIFSMLNRSGKSKNEVYDDIFAYKRLMKMYHPNQSEMDYIHSLIRRGANISTVASIYSFWLTTSEDITIIGDIYDEAGASGAAMWMEESFDRLTNNKYGIQTREQLISYLTETADEEAVMIAGFLSRKGVLGVSEILQRYDSGEDWLTITNDIYQNSSAGKGWTTVDYDRIEDGKKLETLRDITSYITLSYMIDSDNQDFFYSEESGSTIGEKLFMYGADINTAIYVALLQDGIKKEIDYTEDQDTIEAFKEDIRANGVDDAQIDALLKEGYPIIDILNASEKTKNTNESVEEVLEIQREEFITNKGGDVQ